MSLLLSVSIALLVSALASIARVDSVQITSLEVPPEVRNGSGATVLDCEYSLRASEVGPGSGLVVKWFWNNSPAPVYQWIPGKKPQDLGILKGRLDLRYRASDHPATMHRALYITNPSPKLSGEYKCAVSTWTDEDFMIKKMVVYVPERNLTVMYSRADYHTVNVSCRAIGVYPEPKLFLYIIAENKTRSLVPGTRVEATARSGEYDIQLEVLLEDGELLEPTTLSCELRIPDTSYRSNKTIVYYPGSTESVSSAMAEGSSPRTSAPTFILLSLYSALSSLVHQRV